MKNTILGIALLFIASACGSKQKVVPSEAATQTNENIVNTTPTQLLNAGVALGELSQKKISTILKLNGKIDVPPQNMVSVSVPMGGYLKSTQLLPGMRVSKGESIAIMEDRQYIQLQEDYLTAKARISFLNNEYIRQKGLNQSKASSDKVYQQAEMDYNTQRILLGSLSEKLKLACIDPNKLTENNISRGVNIYSPIDGYVSKVNVNIGKYISPTEVLFELINPSDIHLALKVFEKDLDKLSVGQKVVAYTNNNPDKKYNCEILLIGKDLSAERNADVHCHFEGTQKQLTPGMYMNAEVKVENSLTDVLPDDAIVRFENKQYAFIQNSGSKFQMVEVNTGTSENGFTAILNAKEFKDKIFVVRGAYSLLMSLKNKSED